LGLVAASFLASLFCAATSRSRATVAVILVSFLVGTAFAVWVAYPTFGTDWWFVIVYPLLNFVIPDLIGVGFGLAARHFSRGFHEGWNDLK
jgi:Na+/glutamate symporter